LARVKARVFVAIVYVILSAPAIAGASLLVVAVESPTIMDAAVAGTSFSAIPSDPLLHQP
jgi:hypothetical protein